MMAHVDWMTKGRQASGQLTSASITNCITHFAYLNVYKKQKTEYTRCTHLNQRLTALANEQLGYKVKSIKQFEIEWMI